MVMEIENIDLAIEKYDVFMLDLFGVIHDGTTLYPYAESALKKLIANNKKVLFISNGPRRASKAIQTLEKFGIWHDDFTMVTSGETCYHYISTKIHKIDLPEINEHFIFIGPNRDRDLLDDANYIITDNHDQASFMLVTGLNENDSDLHEILKKGRERNLPLICVNPDRKIVKQSGEFFLCAGVVADEYEEMGGKVTYFGKPYPEIYDYCFEIIGNQISKDKIIAIGDSLENDITGASNAGIDNILVKSGIHINDNLDFAEIKKHINLTYIIPYFR
jgi:HAD superfamily hydrolase (TIGR01459 family)